MSHLFGETEALREYFLVFVVYLSASFLEKEHLGRHGIILEEKEIVFLLYALYLRFESHCFAFQIVIFRR